MAEEIGSWESSTYAIEWAGFAVVAPSLALGSLAFGVWYAAAVWSLAPHPF